MHAFALFFVIYQNITCCILIFIVMGGEHKLRLSNVKHHRRKRKEAKLAKQKLLTTVNHDTTSFLISLPLSAYTCGKATSLLHLHDRLNKCGGVSNWQVAETTTERLTLVKMKLIPLPCVAMSVQVYSSFEYCATVDGYQFRLPGDIDICSHVFSVDHLTSLLTTIDSYHLCEGNLCADFPEVVHHNKGKFLGVDRK